MRLGDVGNVVFPRRNGCRATCLAGGPAVRNKSAFRQCESQRHVGGETGSRAMLPIRRDERGDAPAVSDLTLSQALCLLKSTWAGSGD